MIKTLYQRIKEIEAVPEYISIDKDKEIREEFEQFKEKNPVVQAVMNDKTTFFQEWQRAFRDYNFDDGGFSNVAKQLFTEKYSLPQGFSEKVADLEACIGDVNLDIPIYESYLIPNNPIKGGATYGVIALIGSLLGNVLANSSSNLLNRREFFKTMFQSSTVATLGLGSLGVCVGASRSLFAQGQSDILEKNAKYLDEVYTRFYQS